MRRGLLGFVSGQRQRQAKHVAEANSIFEDWLGVILDEEVMVDARYPEALPLVESELITERAGAHLQLPCAGAAEKIGDPLQKRGAATGLLAVRANGDAHEFMRAHSTRLDDARANQGRTP